MPPVLEKTWEAQFVKKCFALGVLAVKLTTPSDTGWPDRMCLFRGGRVLFVELKRQGAKASPKQLHVHDVLRGLGFEVLVCDTLGAAMAAVEEVLVR